MIQKCFTVYHFTTKSCFYSEVSVTTQPCLARHCIHQSHFMWLYLTHSCLGLLCMTQHVFATMRFSHICVTLRHPHNRVETCKFLSYHALLFYIEWFCSAKYKMAYGMMGNCIFISNINLKVGNKRLQGMKRHSLDVCVVRDFLAKQQVVNGCVWVILLTCYCCIHDYRYWIKDKKREIWKLNRRG